MPKFEVWDSDFNGEGRDNCEVVFTGNTEGAANAFISGAVYAGKERSSFSVEEVEE